MKDLIIFGNNDLSQIAHYFISKEKKYNKIYFTVDRDYIKSPDEIVFDQIENYNIENFDFFIPVADNKLREEKYLTVKKIGFNVISYIHPSAEVSSKVGENCFVLENNTIQPFCEIGNNIIFWSGNHIGHHTVIKDSVFFSSHVVVSGHCKIDSYSWFGVNSCIRDNISISKNTFICMGTVLTKSVLEENKKLFGNPARYY